MTAISARVMQMLTFATTMISMESAALPEVITLSVNRLKMKRAENAQTHSHQIFTMAIA